MDAPQQLGLSADTMIQVLNGQASLSPEMALCIEAWLSVANGGAAQVWLAQQAAYDHWQSNQSCKVSTGMPQ